MTFDRPSIKLWAKQRLADGRWWVVLVTFLAGLLGALEGNGVSFNFDIEAETELPPYIAERLVPFVLLVAVGAILYMVLVGNVIHVGYHGWMLRYARGEQPPVEEMFASFRIYKPTVYTMLRQDVFVFLWSLLFVIPGIIKGYAYSMARYIIYDNPNLTPKQVLELSERMTDGHKGELFVLHLSFLGWSLLSALTAGILGVLYVNPYMYLTQAGVYTWLRDHALRTGRIAWWELGLTPPPEAAPTQEE